MRSYREQTFEPGNYPGSFSSLRGTDARTTQIEDLEAFHTCYIVDLSEYRRRKGGGSRASRKASIKHAGKSPPRIITLMRKALEFQRLLDSDEVQNRAELARREGVSRARITQLMKLLKLAPEIQETILGLPPGTPERQITERKLRRIARMTSFEQQKTAFRELSETETEMEDRAKRAC